MLNKDSQMTMETSSDKQSNKKWVIAVALLTVLALVFMIVMIIFVVKYQDAVKKNEDMAADNGVADLHANGDDEADIPDAVSIKQSPKSDKMYSDFTREQYEGLIGYMENESGLNVVAAEDADLNSNYIFSIDPVRPAKHGVVNYLDNDGVEAPMLKAKITLFMGASDPKTISEVIVYPVDVPTTVEVMTYPANRAPTWQSRPVCDTVEGPIIDRYLRNILTPLKPLLEAQFNMWYDDTCGEGTCLFYLLAPRVVPDETNRTLFIMFYYHPWLADYYVWPIPLLLIIHTPDNGEVYEVRKVVYDDVEYDTIQGLVDAFAQGNIRSRTPGLEKNYESSFGSPDRRGKDVNPENLPPPTLQSQAKRFSVSGHHVSWLGWEFDFAFRALSAVQVYNIKFNDERIVYQLGLQDIFVIYTGPTVNKAFRSYMDAGWSIGARSSPLLKGYDCPESAHYIDSLVYDIGKDQPKVLKNSACVFEYRNHLPLRRHYSQDFFGSSNFRFIMDMPDVVLVFRQILTVWNYDYIVDVELHQNGIIRTSLHPTGYVQVVSYSTPGNGVKYGYNILSDPDITALLHNHFFDFKVDLDIGSTNSNRFMTVDIEHETTPHPYNPAVNVSYMVMKESLKSTEQESIIHYDFTKPKQYVVYNNNERNQRNNQFRGYRIYSSNFAHPAMAATDKLFTAASWVNHQIAVTKHKDEEETTVSYFTQGDPYNPHLSLLYFQEDDESIVDTDLVCWVSVGVNHIPTAEDIPVTTTASKDMSFYLIPHNYYKEDPSIASRDATVRRP